MNVFDSPIVLFDRAVILNYLKSAADSSLSDDAASSSTSAIEMSKNAAAARNHNNELRREHSDDQLLRSFFERFGRVQSLQSISLKSAVSRIIVIYASHHDANDAAKFVSSSSDLQRALIGFGKVFFLSNRFYFSSRCFNKRHFLF